MNYNKIILNFMLLLNLHGNSLQEIRTRHLKWLITNKTYLRKTKLNTINVEDVGYITDISPKVILPHLVE